MAISLWAALAVHLNEIKLIRPLSLGHWAGTSNRSRSFKVKVICRKSAKAPKTKKPNQAKAKAKPDQAKPRPNQNKSQQQWLIRAGQSSGAGVECTVVI